MTTIDAKAVGRRIVEARLENGGMMQKDLADALGVSARAVQDWEKGKVVPKRFLGRISELLHRPAAWFLHGDDVDASTRLSFELVALLRESLQLSKENLRVAQDNLNLCAQLLELLHPGHSDVEQSREPAC